MRLHKAQKLAQRLDNHLPSSYTKEVVKRCEERGIEVNSEIVRNVKSFRTKNPAVLEVILEFALENEKVHTRMEEKAIK